MPKQPIKKDIVKMGVFIPRKLEGRAKVLAAKQGRSLTKYVEQLIRADVEGRVRITPEEGQAQD